MGTQFPYERYETLNEPVTVYYPAGEESHARWIAQTVDAAGKQLGQLLKLPVPEMEILLVHMTDWTNAPHDDADEIVVPHPYWTDQTEPSSLVVPLEFDPIFDTMTQEKLAFMLYHEQALAFLESDPRPWPQDYPLWADEWSLNFAALWLAQTLNGVQGMVNADLREEYADLFEPEADGKTPMTIRGFDWYEDTTPEDYMNYGLLLEQFAADLLAHYTPDILPRFLARFRVARETLLSDEVTAMLAKVLGPGGEEWLEELVYF